MRKSLRTRIRFAPWRGGAGIGPRHMAIPRAARGIEPYRDPRAHWMTSDWLAFLFSPSYRADPDPF